MQSIASYWEYVKPYLSTQYKDSPKLTAMIELVVSQLDDNEVMLSELAQLLDLDNAVGEWLDLLGRILGQSRLGMDDDTYRAHLKRVTADVYSGRPEDVIRGVIELGGATTCQYIPEYPAAFFVLAPDAQTLTQELLDLLSPAGVQGFIGCILVDAYGEPIVKADNDPIMTVGPCFPDNPIDEGDGLIVGFNAFDEGDGELSETFDVIDQGDAIV